MRYWLSKGRFTALAIILLLMWAITIGFLYLKADEVTKNPCQVCAKRMGQTILCTTTDFMPISRYFEPNGTIYDKKVGFP